MMKIKMRLNFFNLVKVYFTME